jgi:hypothetical protein
MICGCLSRSSLSSSLLAEMIWLLYLCRISAVLCATEQQKTVFYAFSVLCSSVLLKGQIST